MMKDDYFAPDLESDAALLPNIGPAQKMETATEIPAEVQTPKKWQFMGYDLSTLLIAGAAVMAILVYAVWPDSPITPTFIPDHTNSQTLPDSEAPLTTAQELEYPTAARPQAEPDTEMIKQYSEANREAIRVLNGRLRESEQRLAALEEKHRAAQQRTQAPNPATKPPPTASPSPKQAAPVTAAPRVASAIKGWRVHTLYPGMAWITRQDSTWSVRPGDQLNGLTIRSIDVQRRAVITDKGTIR